eukprot:03519.XXX_100100_100375_1 [CDS] Oithona nana genome sequencing.
MTKLAEWLTALAVVLAIWFSILTQNLWNFSIDYPNLTFLWPLLLLILFGIYSVLVICYRVATFNDCPEAADELQKQIVEAKEDLKRKGLKV